MVTKDLEGKLDFGRVRIELPINGVSLLSHLENINYAIEQIRAYIGNHPVVGYFKMRCLGTKEILHQVVPKEIAETMKIEDKNFNYVTIEQLLKRKKEIEAGKYQLTNGLIIGLDPCYSR